MTTPIQASLLPKKLASITARLLIGLLLISAHSIKASTSETESAAQSSQEEIEFEIEKHIRIIEHFYGKQATGLAEISRVFPAHWLTDKVNWEAEKQKLQSLQPTSDRERALIKLKLMWVMFTNDERNSIISSAKTEETSKNAKEDAQLTLQAAHSALAEQEKQLSQVKDDIAKSRDERHTRLLSIQLDIEQQLETIAQHTKQLGHSQAAFGVKVNQWKNVLDEINSSLEDDYFLPGTRNFATYRTQLRDRLHESNTIIRSEESFVSHYWGNELTLVEEPFTTVQVRESDSAETIDRVNTILRKRVDLVQAKEAYEHRKHTFLRELISWHTQYRKALTEARGKLVHEVIQRNAFSLNNFDPVIVELQTLYANYQFASWREPTLRRISPKQAVKFYQVTHLLKVALVTLLVVWLFLKRAFLMSAAKRWAFNRSTNLRWRKTVSIVLGLVQELYLFFLLFLFADSLIKLLVGFGIQSAALIKPALTQIILFFLFWGLVKYFTPLLSLRDRSKSNQENTQAVEEVFSLVPLIYLSYWLCTGVISTLLHHQLHSSLLNFHVNNALTLSFWLLLFGIIWARRTTWRSINGIAYSNNTWHKISVYSQRKPWEPLVLLIGGGIGVYRVVWQILSGHLKELELTRSFQAMVSRALLERQYRKTTIKLFSERFPDKYWRNFHFQTPAEAHWYVQRESQQAQLIEAYEEWAEKHTSTRILLLGDRGIGKSELIAYFLRQHKVDCLHAAIGTGETSIETVCRKLSNAFLEQTLLSPDELVEALMELEPQILCLENIENTVLRKVGGFEAFATLIDIILRTSSKHLWLTTCTHYAWSIIQHGVTGAECFSEVIRVQGMDEMSLTEAMLARHNDAHHTAPDFSGLSLETEKKAKHLPPRSQVDNNTKGQELYFRILWDYTKGNPRQALYYWKASLAWDEGKCTVHLFEIPEHRILEGLQDRALMLLAGLLEHNGLTLEGMQDVMNCSGNTVRRLIEEISPYGIVFNIESDSVSGWHVESFWTRAVENYLEKRQLLFRSAE